ncbi:zinc dependent phospholipase C family protein [Sporosalibacterium faouarense]|uniref:zinc dependent phospholipase C family protein n=1 Tax=Sporosalibacterium faouarense TaxID=516123 RepID=UPI00192B134C|nr:zinc dependent phospholipase C family protein [Sporosalibacterium faouarense]
MATWVTHLRIAENLHKTYEFSEREFLAGNIGPDCGVPNEDWSSFEPPKKTTHWLRDNEESGRKIDGSKIQAELFYNKYIKDQLNIIDDRKFSFLIGYYTHLLTDIQWSKMHRLKKENDLEYKQRFKSDTSFIWEVKRDWYGIDCEYIQSEKDNVFDKKFTSIQGVKDYIDYFPKGAFTSQIKYIQNFYRTKRDELNPTGRYLTTHEMNDFVRDTSNLINEKIWTRLSEYSLKAKGKNIL